jgi:hypothetical protein
MPTRTFSTVLYNGTDADFRAWVQGILDSLQGMTEAIIQTADTGQIADPVVAVRPALGVSAGYAIFRTNDSQHSAYPLYFKFEFGSGTTAQTFAGMWVTIGTGTDGAGNITGVRFARVQIGRNVAAANGTVYEHACAWGDGWFWLWGAIGNTMGINFGFERNRDIDGNPTDTACYWWHETSATDGLYWVTIPKPPTAVTAFQSGTNGPGLPVLFSPQNPQGEYSSLFGAVPVFPVEPFLGRRQPPLLSIGVVAVLDVGVGVVIQTTMYGSTKTFRRISDANVKFARGTGNAHNGNTSYRPALLGRWE